MRPSLRAALMREEVEAAKALRALAMHYGRPPFRVMGRIDWDKFGAYLMGEAA
jgi:hypothetical protein